MLTPSRLIFGIAAFQGDAASLRCGRILARSIRGWEMRKRKRKPAGADYSTSPRQNFAAAHNRERQNYILFEQFQIALPDDAIGIILRINWYRPGGCQPIPKSELPP